MEQEREAEADRPGSSWPPDHLCRTSQQPCCQIRILGPACDARGSGPILPPARSAKSPMVLTPFQIGERCRRLEQRLRPLLPWDVRVIPTRSIDTWAYYEMKDQVLHVRLSPALLEPPQPVLHSLVDWIHSQGDLGRELDRYFESVRSEWRAYLPPLKIKTAGKTHDLRSLLTKVLDQHFRKGPRRSSRGTQAPLPPRPPEPLAITWGRRAPKQRGAAKQRKIRLGSWDVNLGLIRIHPCLDRVDVPGRFVEFIIFHEALHAAIPPIRDAAGRRRHHHREFVEYERRHPAYDWAEAWEQENIGRLIRTPEGRGSGQSELF